MYDLPEIKRSEKFSKQKLEANPLCWESIKYIIML